MHQMRLMYVVGVVIAAASEVPPFVRLANHPLRWRLLTELAASDQRVRELFECLGEPQSLVSYHLRLLREGGLVTARRNSHDGRDTYYQARPQAGPGRGPRRQPRRALRARAVTGATPGPPRSPGSLAGWGWRRGRHRVGTGTRHRPTSHRRFATARRRAAQPTKVNHGSLGPSGTGGPSKRTTPSAVRSSSTSKERVHTSANPAAENAVRTGVTKSSAPSRLRPRLHNRVVPGAQRRGIAATVAATSASLMLPSTPTSSTISAGTVARPT